MNGQDLVYAILGGNSEKVEALLQAGADPNEVTTSPWTRMTPLSALAASPNAGLEIFSLLLAAGMRLFRDEEASKAWADLTPEAMLERIRLSDIEGERIGAMSEGFLRAVFWDQLEIVRRYLELGLDPNLSDSDGQPALHLARTSEMILLLLEAGADIEGRDEYGRTTLGHACGEGNLDVVRTLVERGADVNATYDHGYSVLMNAAGALEPDPEVVRLLLAHGADARHVSEYGHNPLHELVSGYDGEHGLEREAIASLLIQAGTSLEIRTHRQFTPLNLALLDERAADVLYLLRLGADPNAEVVPETSEAKVHAVPPLFLALPFPELVSALLAAGADPNATDHEGQNALDYAHAEVAKPDAPADTLRQSIAVLEANRRLT
jgi:ankyrin repeat protein